MLCQRQTCARSTGMMPLNCFVPTVRECSRKLVPIFPPTECCRQTPNPEAHLQYKQLLERYRAVYPALKPLFHEKTSPGTATSPARAEGAAEADGAEGPVVGLVNASILAADMADLSGEVSRAVEGGADWIHVDVVDNHFAKVRAASLFRVPVLFVLAAAAPLSP